MYRQPETNIASKNRRPIPLARRPQDSNLAVGRLFEYDNYREFLKDYFEEEKRLRPTFSRRWFAQKAGFKSTGFCSLIVGGSRRLGDASIPRLVEAIGLVGTAAEFLEALIRFNQADTVEHRESCLDRIKRLRLQSGKIRLAAHQFPFWENWYNVAIRELVVHADWNNDFSRLAALVRPRITATEARKSVERLESLGLVVRDDDGKWHHSDPFLTAEGAPASLLREFKREMTIRSLEAMDSLPPSRRHFSTSTISISGETYKAMCEKIERLRSEILRMAETDKPEIVMQANFQVFPLSEPFQDPPTEGLAAEE